MDALVNISITVSDSHSDIPGGCGGGCGVLRTACMYFIGIIS